jgi:3-deoxy-manno-octulosonate cytidylyltransferase (CMP-KDO synthetase)
MAVMPSITVQFAPPVLCIIQARYASTRLPGKMLLKLGEETLIQRGYRLACEAFGPENVVVAIPRKQPPDFVAHLDEIGATVFSCYRAEWDVLGRIHDCAHQYRWQAETVIHRWTPEDAWKSPEVCRAVVEGIRAPVEIGGEAFTLAMLQEADDGEPFHNTYNEPNDRREHIGRSRFLFRAPPPPAPSDDVWTIDTPEDYARACERWEREENVTGANWDRIG